MSSLHNLARPVGMVLVVLGALVALASFGCDAPDPGPPVVEAGFWDEGRTETAMVMAERSIDGASTPIAEGEELRLDHGPQGGSHVEIVVRAEGIDPATARTGARLERADGTVVAEAFYAEYWGEPSAPFELGMLLPAFDDTSGPLLLRVRVRDGAGAQGTTEVGVSVR